MCVNVSGSLRALEMFAATISANVRRAILLTHRFSDIARIRANPYFQGKLEVFQNRNQFSFEKFKVNLKINLKFSFRRSM